MIDVKQLMLYPYYYSSLPFRVFAEASYERRRTIPIAILFYHRVAETQDNDWTISYATFIRQVTWLRDHFEIVTLAEAQSRMQRGNDRRCVSITFDDGYSDNCERALPFLIQKRIPFTYFVSTQNVLRAVPFPHDVAAGDSTPPNSIDQIRELAAAGVEIGAHTRSHADLGAIRDPLLLKHEILGSKQDLELAIGRPVRYFAFPYGKHGNLSAEAFEVARGAGFMGACSAYGGYNFPGDDPFHLQRIHGDPDMIRLKNWLTVDPRKLAMVKRFSEFDC